MYNMNVSVTMSETQNQWTRNQGSAHPVGRSPRAYERARQELKTIELEARPKSDRKPDLHAIEQVHLRRERRYISDDGVGHP